MSIQYYTINEQQLKYQEMYIKETVDEIMRALKHLNTTNNKKTIDQISQQIETMQNDLTEHEKAYTELLQVVEYERSEML